MGSTKRLEKKLARLVSAAAEIRAQIRPKRRPRGSPPLPPAPPPPQDGLVLDAIAAGKATKREVLAVTALQPYAYDHAIRRLKARGLIALVEGTARTTARYVLLAPSAAPKLVDVSNGGGSNDQPPESGTTKELE